MACFSCAGAATFVTVRKHVSCNEKMVVFLNSVLIRVGTDVQLKTMCAVVPVTCQGWGGTVTELAATVYVRAAPWWG